MNAEQVRDTVIAMLSTETGCEPSQLTGSGVHVVARRPESLSLPEHRKFNPHPGRIGIVTLGTGAVISVDPEDLAWAERSFAHITGRDHLFLPENMNLLVEGARQRGLTVHGPFPRFTCPPSALTRVDTPVGYTIRVIDIEAEDAANGHTLDRAKFPNALSPGPGRSGRPTVLAAVARKGSGEVAGIAGVSKDSDFMWQIGIDVLPAHRGRGLAPAMTCAAAMAVFEAGALPYYGTSSSNIPSMRTALTAGLRPTWTEVLTRPA
jgi:hypothetical protein